MYRDTSRDAWASFMPYTAELDRAIMRAISDGPAIGLTGQDIEDRLDRSHQSVSGNMTHLREKGLIEFSGYYGQTRSGRRAMRWVLSEYAHTGQADLVSLARAGRSGEARA